MELDLVTLIAQVGFPIAVAAYVLVRLNSSLNSLRDEIVHLRHELKAYTARERAA